VYRELDPERIIATLATLGQRIEERFPASGLGRVGRELLALASESKELLDRLRRPNAVLRTGVGVGVLALVALAVATALSVRVSLQVQNVSDLLQGLDAGVNDVIFMGIAIYFLLTVEGRLKRRRALRALHELRSVAHIIDMHQLTKDPDRFLLREPDTPSSPQRTMTRFELSRYLDYCSELLSHVSKLAALHAQYLADPVVLDAVNDVETLADGLSRKIWQKIMILDAIGPADAPVPPGGR